MTGMSTRSRKRRKRYPQDVRHTAARATEIRGVHGWGASGKQIQKARRALLRDAKEQPDFDGQLTVRHVLAAAGVENVEELRAMAEGHDKAGLQRLYPLTIRLRGGRWLSGRWLAAILTALIEHMLANPPGMDSQAPERPAETEVDTEDMAVTTTTEEPAQNPARYGLFRKGKAVADGT